MTWIETLEVPDSTSHLISGHRLSQYPRRANPDPDLLCLTGPEFGSAPLKHHSSDGSYILNRHAAMIDHLKESVLKFVANSAET